VQWMAIDLAPGDCSTPDLWIWGAAVELRDLTVLLTVSCLKLVHPFRLTAMVFVVCSCFVVDL